MSFFLELHPMNWLFSFSLILCSVFLCRAAVYGRTDELQQSTSWDFVIIGGSFFTDQLYRMLINLPGGTAGSVLANRLTEDLNTSVLVLEAGVRY